MKYKLTIIAILSILFVSALSICAEQVQSIPEGMKPYTPTRLEWLAVELNAMYRIDMNDLEGYMLTFMPKETENSILIFVQPTRQTNRKAMNRGIGSARKLIERNAKSRGWSSWLKISEEIASVD